MCTAKTIDRCLVEITEMLDVFDKDFKSAIIKIFKHRRVILKGKMLQQRNKGHKEQSIITTKK